VVRRPSRRRGFTLAAGFFVLSAASLAGTWLPTPVAREPVYLVQSGLGMYENWTAETLDALLGELERRVLAAYARNQARPGLVVFPEMPAPLYYHDDPLLRARLSRLARQTQSRLLVNVIAFADRERRRPLNSAVLIGPGGEFLGRYDKIHLVPFGEYVPYQPVFFFAGKLTAEVGDFVPGDHPEPIGPPRPLAVLICYEGIFPELVRKFTSRGAQALVNISNDGWYGTSAARDQLLLMARLRAVENGRWLLRATNTGISAIVDPYGRARTFPLDERNAFTGAFGYASGRTAYVAFGHWFPLAAAAAALALVGLALGRRTRVAARREEPSGAPDGQQGPSPLRNVEVSRDDY